jgi:hypothetical protein
MNLANSIAGRKNDMSADGIRLRIEEAVSLVADFAVDPIADGARFIEDLELDSRPMLEPPAVGYEASNQSGRLSGGPHS